MTDKKVREVEEIAKRAVEEMTRRFNVKEVVIPEVDDRSRGFTSPGVMSIIYADTGKRITISPPVYKKIGRPKKIQIAMIEEGIFIGEKLPKGTPPLRLNPERNKKNMKATLYNIDLLEVLIEAYDLDFESKSSITFHEVEYIEEYEKPIAFIKLIED